MGFAKPFPQTGHFPLHRVGRGRAGSVRSLARGEGRSEPERSPAMLPTNELFNWANGMSQTLKARLENRPRKGAIGKALIVYLFSGSLLVAVVAYLIFRGMGC
jgi:hypothetical protein